MGKHLKQVDKEKKKSLEGGGASHFQPFLLPPFFTRGIIRGGRKQLSVFRNRNCRKCVDDVTECDIIVLYTRLYGTGRNSISLQLSGGTNYWYF